ncbi:hypothetical protein BJX66DRAFT_303022 [Aspergillus keveii]|uniref:Uncharacterized protein n=1 Tax=Aspergillus keveii TaxID=714993 RepID=A0ABR4G7B8_9EURO
MQFLVLGLEDQQACGLLRSALDLCEKPSQSGEHRCPHNALLHGEIESHSSVFRRYPAHNKLGHLVSRRTKGRNHMFLAFNIHFRMGSQAGEGPQLHG